MEVAWKESTLFKPISELYLFPLMRPSEARERRVSKEATSEHPSVLARSHFQGGRNLQTPELWQT